MRHIRKVLINNLSKESVINKDDGFQRFCHMSLDALYKHSPGRKKYARGNQVPFFNNELSKAKMTRTILRNIFLQNESEKSRIHYRKHINFCVSHLKKRYYENLNKTLFVDNKLIGKQ